MVFPLLGAIAGAGGSIASALLGADAQDEANQYNWMANIYNLRQREKERREARQYADELRSDQKLGGTDALGNRTRFKEGEGWVTELSPEQQELYDYFYNNELPERRKQFERSSERSRGDDDIANSLLGEFRRLQQGSPKEVEALLYQLATRGASEGAGDVAEAALRQATRTGNSNIAEIIGSLGRQSMQQRGDARVNAAIQAKDHVAQQFAGQRGQLAQLYNMFATRGSNSLGASYDPSGIPQGANQLMSLFSQQAQQGNSMGFNAAQMRGGTLDYIEPNMAYANAAGAIGSALGGLGDRAGSISDRNANNALLRQYITAGGQIDLGNGGIFGSSADRLRANSSVY